MAPETTEGHFEFLLPSVGTCKTWYRVYGDLSSSKTPLLVLHGGPGFTYRYVQPIETLAEKYGIPVIGYDQIGCGNSTHLREKNGDEEFWTVDLFLAELDHMLQSLGISSNYDLLGHSWGGMLAAEHAIRRQPKGLRKLILSNSPSSIPGWAATANRYLQTFPQDMRDKLAKHEAAGTVNSDEYQAEMMKFYEVHTCNAKPLPKAFVGSMNEVLNDPTVYYTMQGPNEFTITGNLRDWSVIDTCKNIRVPTLLINGSKDIADYGVMEPWIKNVPDLKFITFENSSHCPHLEEPEAYFQAVGEFLSN